MALFTKCILKHREEIDGICLSVMSRHTLNDGITPDARITHESFDEHYPELAPSAKLLGDYYKRGLSWVNFESRFLEEIKKPSLQVILAEIAAMALFENVTLLCIEETAEHCHRRILAEECKRLVPQIIVEHH